MPRDRSDLNDINAKDVPRLETTMHSTAGSNLGARFSLSLPPPSPALLYRILPRTAISMLFPRGYIPKRARAKRLSYCFPFCMSVRAITRIITIHTILNACIFVQRGIAYIRSVWFRRAANLDIVGARDNGSFIYYRRRCACFGSRVSPLWM